MDGIAALLALQDGVISRRQALDQGLLPHAIERLLRRRDWVAVHPGVYVDHTGPPSWHQRAWAAVLACWPAALDGRSSLRAHEGPGRRGGDTGPISVMVAHHRRIDPPAGVRVRRSRRFDEQVRWNLSPPRLPYDDTVVEIADCAVRELDVVAALADACGARRTTAARLRARVDATPRLHRRALLLSVLDDVAAGTCSVLEHRFLTHVERPHGLPRLPVLGRSGEDPTYQPRRILPTSPFGAGGAPVRPSSGARPPGRPARTPSAR